MAELTAESIRQIIREEIHEEIKGVRPDITKDIRNDIKIVYDELSQKIDDGIASVINTVQRLSDQDRDEFAGIRGRLSNHNERIAHLERLNHLR
jgi:ribosome-binding ATPase YchF (GTP1/OBG family)